MMQKMKSKQQSFMQAKTESSKDDAKMEVDKVAH
jgi:hypothetical protein